MATTRGVAAEGRGTGAGLDRLGLLLAGLAQVGCAGRPGQGRRCTRRHRAPRRRRRPSRRRPPWRCGRPRPPRRRGDARGVDRLSPADGDRRHASRSCCAAVLGSARLGSDGRSLIGLMRTEGPRRGEPGRSPRSRSPNDERLAGTLALTRRWRSILARAAARPPIALSPLSQRASSACDLFSRSRHLHLDGRGPSSLLPLGFFQRCLRLVHGLLAAFTLLLPSSLFTRRFPLAPFLLFFEGESGLSLRRLVEGAGGGLLRLGASQLAGGFRRSFTVAQIGR